MSPSALVRRLRRRPAPATLAALSLALGLAGATAVVAVLHALLLDPLPFADADRLVRVEGSFQGRELGVSWADYHDWRDDVDSFAASTFFNGSWLANVDFTGETETLRSVLATSSFFAVLGTEPALGRAFAAGDEAADAPLVAVIADSLWRRRFGGDPEILGETLSVGGDAVTVVGVMPPGFDYPMGTEMWVVATRWFDPGHRDRRIDRVVARLAPGVPLERAAAEMDAVAARLADAHPETNAGVGTRLVRERDVWVAELRPALLLLGVGAALFLVAAFGNAASLLVAEGVARRRDVAVRRCLGATPRTLLAEDWSTAAAIVGVAVPAAWLLAAWGVDVLAGLLAEPLPAWARPRLGGAEAAFLVAAGGVAALLLGPFATLAAWRGAVARDLRLAGVAAGDASTRRARGALATLEIAAATLLLLAGGLLLASLRALAAVDLGFEPARAVVLEGTFSYRRGLDAEAWGRILDEVERRLAALPGVVAVGATSDLPLVGQETWDRVDVAAEGEEAELARAQPAVNFQAVDPGYFAAMGIAVVAGRGLAPDDAASDVRPIVVSRRLAERRWPGRSALGRRLRIGDGDAPWHEVVGVVADVRHHAPGRDPGDDLYVPYLHPWKEMHLVVRTSAAPAPLVEAARRAAASVSPDFGILRAFPLRDLVAASVWRPRLWTGLFAAFSLLALVLAAAGVYGVLAHGVEQRRPELALRLALGASPLEVLLLVLAAAAKMIAGGVVLGLAGAFAFERLLATQLFGVHPTDPTVLATTLTLLTTTALLAATAPARRAAKVDPARALRGD